MHNHTHSETIIAHYQKATEILWQNIHTLVASILGNANGAVDSKVQDAKKELLSILDGIHVLSGRIPVSIQEDTNMVVNRVIKMLHMLGMDLSAQEKRHVYFYKDTSPESYFTKVPVLDTALSR